MTNASGAAGQPAATADEAANCEGCGNPEYDCECCSACGVPDSVCGCCAACGETEGYCTCEEDE